MIKVIMTHALSGTELFEVNGEYDFEDTEAIRLVDAGLATPKSKKAYDNAVAKVEKQKAVQKQKEEQAAAILHKEELEDERAKLQARVDEITHSLDDGAVYYKSYASLAEDLGKQKGEGDSGNTETGNTNENGSDETDNNSENDTPPGEGK